VFWEKILFIQSCRQEVFAMGIFEEEAWQMAEEAAAQQRQEAQRAAEIAQVVRTVNEDLMSYIGNHPRQQSIEIGAHENRITLRKKHPTIL
jgi:hypothetical protein